MNLNNIALELHQAADAAKAIPQISHKRELSIDEAYVVQSLSMAYRYQQQERFAGLKMGFTSVAKMEQMGIQDMIWGRLTSSMDLSGNSQLKLSSYIHPRAEPEIAFLIKKDIHKAIPLEEVQDYIAGVAIAIEVIDSRYENFKFSLEDVIADNCSSTAFKVGEWKDLSTNIQDIKMTMSFDGQEMANGSSSAILGNPYKSFAAATRLAHQYSEPLKKDMIILAGAATAASYIKTTQKIVAEAPGLGTVSFTTSN